MYLKLIRRTSVTIVMSDKVDFRRWTITTERECHHVVIKRTIHQEHVTILNLGVYTEILASLCLFGEN